MEALAHLPASRSSHIRAMVEDRLVRAPKKIKRKISKDISRNNFFIVTYSMENVFVALILAKKFEEEVKSRARVGMQPIPGFVVPASENSPSVFGFENSQNVVLANISVEGAYALSVGDNCRIIVDRLGISVTDDLDKTYESRIELGFVISGEGGKSIFAVEDVISDLLAYYVSEQRE